MEMKIVSSMVFRVNSVPKPQPRQKSWAYKDKATGQAKSGKPYTEAQHPVNVFKAAVAEKVAPTFADRAPFKGPLHLGLTVVLPRPASLTREWKSTGRVPMIKIKGDNDNFEKTVYDALECIAYDNDCRIYSNFTQVYFAAEDESPHAIILIEEHQYVPAEEEVPPDGRKRSRKTDRHTHQTSDA